MGVLHHRPSRKTKNGRSRLHRDAPETAVLPLPLDTKVEELLGSNKKAVPGGERPLTASYVGKTGDFEKRRRFRYTLRSPRPVSAGLGLDNVEVRQHFGVVAFQSYLV